jgi:hypothetical protein
MMILKINPFFGLLLFDRELCKLEPDSFSFLNAEIEVALIHFVLGVNSFHQFGSLMGFLCIFSGGEKPHNRLRFCIPKHIHKCLSSVESDTFIPLKSYEMSGSNSNSCGTFRCNFSFCNNVHNTKWEFILGYTLFKY